MYNKLRALRYGSRSSWVDFAKVLKSTIHHVASYNLVIFSPFLLQLEATRDLASVDLQQILLSMRRQRLGLIQTADQLRFSYIAVLQGALQDLELEPSNYDDLSDSEEDVPEEDSDEESDSELIEGITSLIITG